MKILWDFRLFSSHYKNRGIGVFATRMAAEILKENHGNEIFIWGQKKDAPPVFHDSSLSWINYTPHSWKIDALAIPVIIMKYRIQVFHYWVACGPLFTVGLGLFHPCKTCCVVHDCAVWLWDDVEHCLQVRKTWYWKIQKKIIPKINWVVCNSQATLLDVHKVVIAPLQNRTVMYAPLPNQTTTVIKTKEKRFVMLSAAPHKNTAAGIAAFQKFRNKYPEFTLCIYGDGANETKQSEGQGIVYESMNNYWHGLETSFGLVFCSLHEGLGLPPLEALSRGCPLILSDSAVFRETCQDSALFVDPRDVFAIATALETLTENQTYWQKKSSAGAARYASMSKNAGKKWLDLYDSLKRV